ncbi:MAG: hypothetical protein P4L83_02495 [Nevskia sp.]|nr:hypothetical protein [Nevskia sp.]
MTVATPPPNVLVPIVDPDTGVLTQAGLRFFLSLWSRSGGAPGIDLTAIQAQAAAAQATAVAAAAGVSTEATARAAADALLAPKDSPSFTTAATATAPGVFTNTLMNQPFVATVGATLDYTGAYGALQAYNTATSGLVGGVNIPSNSTVWGGFGVAGFAENPSTATNAVGGYFQARAKVAGSKTWGSNSIVTDGGFSATVQGVEIDLLAANAATLAVGVNVTGAFGSSDLANGTAISVAVTGTGRWNVGYYSHDGATPNGMILGASSSAANSDGQYIQLQALDNTATHRLCTIRAVHTSAGADLHLGAVTGNVISDVPLQATKFLAGSGGTTISSGTGAPTSSTPGYAVGGSMFLRTDGGTGSRLYVSSGSAWAAVAGV